jgi:hypothetical protein
MIDIQTKPNRQVHLADKGDYWSVIITNPLQTFKLEKSDSLPENRKDVKEYIKEAFNLK